MHEHICKGVVLSEFSYSMNQKEEFVLHYYNETSYMSLCSQSSTYNKSLCDIIHTMGFQEHTSNASLWMNRAISLPILDDGISAMFDIHSKPESIDEYRNILLSRTNDELFSLHSKLVATFSSTASLHCGGIYGSIHFRESTEFIRRIVPKPEFNGSTYLEVHFAPLGSTKKIKEYAAITRILATEDIDILRAGLINTTLQEESKPKLIIGFTNNRFARYLQREFGFRTGLLFASTYIVHAVWATHSQIVNESFESKIESIKQKSMNYFNENDWISLVASARTEAIIHLSHSISTARS